MRTPTLFSRITFTAALLTGGGLLVLLMLWAVQRPDARIAAYGGLCLGLWFLMSLLTLPLLWRPSAEWRRQQYEARRLERRLRAAFAPRVVRSVTLRGLQVPCPVCGQDGPTLRRSRLQCTGCQRPWEARAA